MIDMMRFRVHVSDPRDCRPFYIAGETIQDAIEANKRHLLGGAVTCGTCEIWDHQPLHEYEVLSAEYAPGILGGRGGWRVRVKYSNHAYGQVKLCEEWIYADEEGNPTNPKGRLDND